MKKILSAMLAMGLVGVVLCIPGFIVKGQNPVSVNQGVPGAVYPIGCFGAFVSGGLISLPPMQQNYSGCVTTTAFIGTPFPPGVMYGLRLRVQTTNSNHPLDFVVVYKNAVATAVTCVFGTGTTCSDITHSVSVAESDDMTVRVQSEGGVFTGPTYSSGSSACTNGTQAVAFTNGGGSGATGTITVAGNVPTGAVTMTNPFNGVLYTAVPTAGTVATCTGAAVFTGGTFTADTLSGVTATIQFAPAQ